jgi:hypothetical protein
MPKRGKANPFQSAFSLFSFFEWSEICPRGPHKITDFVGRGGAMEKNKKFPAAKQLGILNGAEFAPTMWCR